VDQHISRHADQTEINVWMRLGTLIDNGAGERERFNWKCFLPIPWAALLAVAGIEAEAHGHAGGTHA
jgi:hypothetical protein